ncbi:hypothetical protein BAX95_09365 [Elizabethkingia meningoseptica]|nr:hypothetical protein BAX95_09365 [Elizabethkingia meningoseptica]
MGYKNKEFLYNNSQSTILLKQKIFEIPEVKILEKKLYKIGKELQKSTTKIGVLKDIEIGTLIINPYKERGLLKSISLPIKKISSQKGYIILNFYDKSNNENENPILINDSPLIVALSKIGRKNNEIDLSNNKIYMPSNALLVGIMVSDSIGSYTSKRDLPEIEMYNTENKQIMYFKVGRLWKAYSMKTNAINYILEILR